MRPIAIPCRGRFELMNQSGIFSRFRYFGSPLPRSSSPSPSPSLSPPLSIYLVTSASRSSLASSLIGTPSFMSMVGRALAWACWTICHASCGKCRSVPGARWMSLPWGWARALNWGRSCSGPSRGPETGRTAIRYWPWGCPFGKSCFGGALLGSGLLLPPGPGRVAPFRISQAVFCCMGDGILRLPGSTIAPIVALGGCDWRALALSSAQRFLAGHAQLKRGPAFALSRW
jgi:hypothetical protein